ncbi:hypothetical protein DCU88_03750 [Campylobacter upsaliensis]|nr:hypothetical protein [Campylobacter upsaliensis]
MQFNFNFEAFEQSGKEKNEAINYLKSLNSSIDFDKLEQENKGDENAIYEALKGGNFSFSKPSIEQTRQKLLKNKENEALKAEFNAGLSWLGEEKKQNFNFYDFKKAKEKANSKLGLIQADLKAKEKELKRKEALFETRLKERGIIAKSFDDMLDQSGAYLGADLLEKGLNKLGFKDENYIFESEKEDIKSRALKSVREKLERGDLEFNEREKHALRSKYDELDYKKALEKEKERLRLSQKSGNFSEAEREFIENDLGFFNTLFNDDKENIKEFKEKVKSEGVISSEIIKAANTLKAFDEGNLFKNMLFADEKEKKEFQQNFLNDAYKIAELSGFDDVGLDKKGELYFIKDEQKYLVNTGFFDNFAQLLNDTKFEFAGGVLGGLKGFNSGKSAKGKVAKSILGAAAGSFGGAFLDAKIADMYLNRESDFKKNLDFAIQAGLLSMAGDGVILSVKPLAKGLYKGVKKGGEILGEYSILGTLKTLPQQNIQAAEKIIDEVFSPKMKEELKAAQEEFGGSVRGEDLKNAFFANLQKKFTQKYGENDSKTKSVAKIAEIFNTNSLKTRQQAMLDLVRSDTHGSTLAYLLEIAKDDVKIQSNLKNMLNLASSNVEKNLKNLNINAREIKHILDEFEAGNKAAFKEVESQISKLYDENYRVVLSKGEYENIKEEFRQNGVNLEEMTPFLRDLEANVFNENGVSFTQLNNFRKNLNFYIFNKDKTPNFINTLKKIGENILKNEIDKGIDNIFSQNKAAYESIKELYSTSLKDYATLKSLNESIKNLKLQDSAKSADEVLNSLIKYAKGQGEKGVNNLQKIKDYLGEENNAFLEMQILNKLFKESVVENDRASLRVFDSESFLGRVRELVGDTPAPLGANLEARALSGASQGPSKQENFIKKALNKDEAKLFLENLNGAKIPKKLDIEGFLKELESVENKENFISHLSKKEDAQSRLAYLNLVEPTLKEADLILHNGKRQDYIKKFNDGKDFFTLLITEENGKRLITFLPKTREDFIKNKIDNASLIQSFTSRASKQGNGLANESITQPLFKSKEAREFLELVEGFHKLYKNDASIAKNLVQGTASQLSTSIATSAEGAIKQKVVKGGFDPIFRLLPDKILFGLFSKQIQGGALRYHLKKALSRSLNYDDFKIKLEKELKRTNFNSNTSRLIDEFMQNLEDFNREKEQFLEAKRIEQARIKEEEQARINTIKTAQENAYNAQEANLGKDILESSSLKEDFGENFAGYKGKEAIEKLLEEQRGQVKGAFYKEGLGEIDLVWGDKNYGLRHIIEQRTKQWGEEKALKFISHLNENIEKGQIVEVQKGRAAIKTDLTTIILDKKENNNFVLTAFRDRNNKKELESLNLSQSKTFTSENAEANAKESPVTSLNQESIIAQNAKNDEVLEAEVIEEVGLNEPMKFLEFQQRKLLTYIKENTPLRLLEHKKELKTRDILNFLEQSALNGKQKVFLMRNLERDLEKLEAQLKEAEEVGFKEAKNAVDDDFLKGYDEKIKQNIKSLEFENELIENQRPRGREPQDRYISLAYFMANFAQHYKLLDLKNPRTKEQIELLENALKKQNIGYEVLENEPVAIRYFKKEGVKRQGAKQKTINKVDEYAKSEEFKALSEDKQEAILSLKNLEPSIMPSEISKDNLENILKHFNSKQDKARREFYAKLFNDTKENPHIVLEVKRENELRQEYIKAYQHKDTHDLYYIAITKDKDTINVTGYPITKIKDVINQIKNAEKVVWRQQGDQTHTALVSKETQNLESVNESIAQNAKSERAEFESFKDKIKELYTKYEGLSPYDKSESQLRIKLLDEEIEPEIKKEFKNIIDKFKGADNKDKILRVIKENKEELSDYLAFHIALRKDIDIDGYGVGKVDFYDKSIRDFIKFRENKRWSEIDESKYRALAALENLSNKNTSLYFSFRDLNGKVGEFKTYPRIQDLLFYDLILGYDLKNAVILSTKDKHLKEKLIEKLKAYIDKKIYADFLEYKIKDLESRNPKNSYFENYKDEKWDEEALKSFKKELEDLRAKEKGTKLEAKGSEDIIFTDKKGKEHTLTKETQKAWLEAFGLKSLEEAYIPNFKAEVKEAINRVLGGEEIKLTEGSFEKLLKRDREEFLPYIKDTLEKADLIIKDKENALIFVKDIGKKSYFTSVAKNANNEWVISTNSLKTLNTLKNRVDDNGEVLYLSKEAPNILAEAFTKRAFSNELAKDIIPQKPQQKALNLQEIEQTLKARKSQINDEISANDKAFKENLKEVSKVKPILEALKKEWEALEPTIVTWTHTDYSKAKPKKYYKRKPNLSNLWHIEETLDVYKGYARESDRHANQVAREIALLEKYVKLLKDKEAEVKAFKAKAEADENALILESRIIPIYNQLREAFKKGHHTTKQILEANNIKQDSVQAKEVIDSIAQTRQYLEDTFNIKPLEEFGTNYAEFYRDGKGAVEKLLKEAEDFKQRGEKGEFKGQVAGAFYKEGLGEIDLVWGDENFGLRHIIDKHGDEFEDIAAELDEIIAKGVLEKGEHRYFIKHNDYKGMIALDYKGKESNAWILTLYKDKSALNPAYQHQIKHNTNTSSETRANGEFENSNIKNANLQKEKVDKLFHGDAEVISAQGKFNELEALNLTDEDIIPQQKIKFAMEKFNYDEKKAKDLLEWHKNSHALTKDENGLPKVFYHGTYSKFRVFRRVGKASQQGFFFTPSQKATEEYGDITLNTFLNIKNPFRADELKINKEADLQKWADILKLDYDKEKYESFKDLKTKLEKVKEATKKAGFKFHSASGGSVYVIDNKGRNRFINLEELDKENKRVVEAFKGLETEDIYFYYVVRNEFDLVLYALNKNDRYFHKSGRDEVKRVLEKLGYDGVVLNDTIITVFNSNQIKHIDNKGSFTDTKGNVTSKKPKDKEVEFSYFNEKSDNIYHSNPHLGAGLVGGVLNGVEQDENGNLSFDPVKFAMGFLGGAAGSKAVKESIKWRANKVKKAYPNIAKNNPTLMQEIAKRDLLTYAKNETQNALTRLLNKNKLFDSTKGLFAGEKALLNEAYAPHKARLEKAKELEGSGADEIEIWEKTGWYKDKDHKWKFEISQRGGELDLAKIKDKDSEAKLGEILKDDELFKAYPQLRDMSVKHVDLSGNYGFYYVPYNDIKLVRPHIQLDIDEIKTSPYKVKEVLYHEIQHAIQHKEQFAYGLSYMAETYERYLKQHGEVEARNIQERMKNPTKIHPHKTMDTDIEDTIAESTLNTEYSEAFSRKLEKSFLDESGRIAYKSLIHKAEVLPQSLNLKGFKQMIFNNDKTKQLNAENALIKTPVGEVKVNVLRAFNHYMKNGKNGNHKENRQALNATFMPTLLEPKFVTRDEEGTMYYYKPFISKDKEYHITSIAVKKNGNLDYATSYNATENRLRQMIKHNELVYEKD